MAFALMRCACAGRPSRTTAKLVEALRRRVDSVVAIYQKAFRRPPTLSELMHNFLFILGHKPEWYLAGVESLEVEDIASTDGV
jgi:hypothetical protein